MTCIVMKFVNEILLILYWLHCLFFRIIIEVVFLLDNLLHFIEDRFDIFCRITLMTNMTIVDKIVKKIMVHI